tara:strand:- start:156 stop:314 length:159 start_codon:yes stop_codon:yes gene_type:complete
MKNDLIEARTKSEYEIDCETTLMGYNISGFNKMEYSGLSSSLIRGQKTRLKN